MIDSTRYADVESKPDVMSGAFVVWGTRVLAQAVVDNPKTGAPPSRSWPKYIQSSRRACAPGDRVRPEDACRDCWSSTRVFRQDCAAF